MDKPDKSRWEKSKYAKQIRISKENLEFIRRVKQKKSMAGMLAEIIGEFRKTIDIISREVMRHSGPRRNGKQ